MTLYAKNASVKATKRKYFVSQKQSKLRQVKVAKPNILSQYQNPCAQIFQSPSKDFITKSQLRLTENQNKVIAQRHRDCFDVVQHPRNSTLDLLRANFLK